jgi:hypothetical protein
MNNLKDVFAVAIEFNGNAGPNKWISRGEAKYARWRIRQICNLHDGKTSEVVGRNVTFIFESHGLAEKATDCLRNASDLFLERVKVLQGNQEDQDARARNWQLTACKVLVGLEVDVTEPRDIGEDEEFLPIEFAKNTCMRLGGKFFAAQLDDGWADVHYMFADESQVCLAQETLEDHGFDVVVHSCAPILRQMAA